MFEGNALKTMLFMYVCIESFIEKKMAVLTRIKVNYLLLN